MKGFFEHDPLSPQARAEWVPEKKPEPEKEAEAEWR